MIEKIITILSKKRLSIEREKETQAEIENIFIENGISFLREPKLDSKNIPDFIVGDIVVEVKIKGNAKSIYKQCERYCDFENVNKLILITNRSMGFPKEINGKPCYFLNIGKSWL